MVSLLNVWTPVFPQWITDNIRDQLIIPRIQVRYRLILVEFSRAAAHHGQENLVFYASTKFWFSMLPRNFGWRKPSVRTATAISSIGKIYHLFAP